MGKQSGGITGNEPVILVAEDLAPSETVQLDKSLVLSFVSKHGSTNSHTAILADNEYSGINRRGFSGRYFR